MDYTEEYSMESELKNVMFCVYKRHIDEEHEQINMPLRYIQNHLFDQSQNGIGIKKAFVYAIDKIRVKPFNVCEMDAVYYYGNENCSEDLSISQLCVMALQLLEIQDKENPYGENQLYMIVDGEYSAVDSKKTVSILAEFAERFSYKLILIRNMDNQSRDALEEYAHKKGELYSFSDFQKYDVIGG